MFELEPQINNLSAAMQLKIRPNRINQYGLIVGPGPNNPAGQAFILTPQQYCITGWISDRPLSLLSEPSMEDGTMPAKIDVLKLTVDERRELETLVRRERAAGGKLQRAQALLQSDQGADGPGGMDADIAEAYGGISRSVETWRKQAMEQGPLSLLERKPRSDKGQGKLDGTSEAQLVKLACSQAPVAMDAATADGNPLTFSGLRNGAAGTRTQNQRIMSPLL